MLSTLRNLLPFRIPHLLSAILLPLVLSANPPPPEEYLGFEVGADYRLARWDEILGYFEVLAAESPRVRVREIGQTTEGRPMILAEISSAETIAAWPQHQDQQRRIADPRLIRSDEEEQRLIEESKVVVLINCNLHSTEVASSQLAMELAYELATGESDRMREIRERVIVLLVPSANPDGLDLVIDWYEQSLGTPWEGTGMPWLYQRYAGHDNNRDWFMLNLKETRLLTEILYHQWRPTIVYDVHQMGNRGARFFVPPFHDPKNPNVPPLTDHMLMVIGGHMAGELARQGKQGVIHGAIYDNWWAGGFRTTVYRHNMIGLLTEAASALIASPVFQRKSELRGGQRGLPDYEMATNFPDPWPGGWWRLRDIVEYEKIACMSVFTLAARYHDLFQSNFIHLGRRAIRRGLELPPFAWLVPNDQRDPGSARLLLEILGATGVEIHRAREQFEADGIEYDPGTYILFCSQPYRPHLMDMMERQEYPNRSTYPGGPAEAPYDMAGWTLPLQMGVRAVAVSRRFEVDAEAVTSLEPARTPLDPSAEGEFILVRASANDDYRFLNRLHEKRIPVEVVAEVNRSDQVPPGSLLLRKTAALDAVLPDLVNGITLDLSVLPFGTEGKNWERLDVRPPRLGLYQPWTASMDEGWTRLVLEQFEFPYRTVHNAEIRAGSLRERYDSLVLPSLSPGTIIKGRAVDTTAPPYAGGIGLDGVVQLQEFVRAGGTLVCIDDACNLPINYFNIPVRNVLAGVRSDDFYCPGSILRASVSPEHPVGFGLPEWVSVYFARSQAFEVGTARPDPNPSPADTGRTPSERYPARVVARYSDTVLLESGWIRGGERLKDKPAIVEVDYGEGRIILIGFAVQHRGQPHGTFRFLFNAIQAGAYPLRQPVAESADRRPRQ